MKTCRICNESKSLDKFGISKSNVDGRDNRCKSCRSSIYRSNRDQILANSKARYAANPEAFRKRKTESYERNKNEHNAKRRSKWNNGSCRIQNELRNSVRKKCFNILGGKCNDCGHDDYDVLCVDHINDDGKQERKLGIAPVTIWRKIIRGDELGRYQLLCFNCNLRKSILRDRIGLLTNQMKKCATCFKILDSSFFKHDIKYQDGRYYECRECTRNRVITSKVIAALKVGSNKCACGVHDILVLTFDHIHEDGHETRIFDGVGESLYRRIIKGYADAKRFQILCLNCNLKKHKQFVGAKKIISGFGALVESDKSRIFSKKIPVDGSSNLIDFNFKDAIIKIESGSQSIIEFLQKWHYAGYGRNGSVHVTCCVNGEIAAVAKFASAIRQEVATSIKLKYDEILELDRFCINPKYQKKNFASFFLSSASKLVKLHNSKLVALVSFADPAYGHSGTIYKAANWIEVIGRRHDDYQYRRKDGSIIHKKTVFNSAKSRNITESRYSSELGLVKVTIPAKRKFVFRF